MASWAAGTCRGVIVQRSDPSDGAGLAFPRLNDPEEITTIFSRVSRRDMPQKGDCWGINNLFPDGYLPAPCLPTFIVRI